MKEISEMIRFVDSHARYQGKTFPSKEEEQDKTDIFYEKVLSGEFESEEQAATTLFGKKDHRYKRLKRKMVDGLVNSVLVSDLNSKIIHSHSRAYYTILKELTVAKILLGKTLHRSAIFFTKRCHKRAKQHKFYDILEDTTRILKNHYGRRVFRESEFLYYSEELRQIKKIVNLEDKADSYYSQILINDRRDRTQLSKNIELADQYFNDLSAHLETCRSLKFQVMARFIRIFSDSCKCDFISMLSNTEQDLTYFQLHHKNQGNAYYIFLIQKTTACIRLGMYEKGLGTIRLALSLIDEKNINWFPMKYNEFFIQMQSGNYSEAQRIYHRVIHHKRYNDLVDYMQEDWITGGAYLNYVKEKGLLEIERSDNFKIAKFMNSVPKYSKDRRVKNIPILIAQIIFMIYRKQTGKVIDRMDAIKQYCGRNLRYNEAVRSNSFIMALMEIPKQSFNKIAVERHITRFTKRLEEVPLHLSGKNFDLEIIPYERLLGYVLEDL